MRDVIADIYRQVDAPGWAAPNLDGLVDVLRDLSWLPEGPVELVVPEATWDLVRALVQVVDETADGPRPVRVRTVP
ncbi:MAG: barstar family protein [Jatrophihabitans sp.]|uniref:barstar family protein n=1 Tax=Jatrophihabitans sp. TaxID=1932789 RepID=UPI003F7DE374